MKANGGTRSGWEDSESEDESQVNHPSKAAKKEETKFEEIRRLKEEGISHAEREEYWHSISKFDDALQIIRGLPKEGILFLILIDFLSSKGRLTLHCRFVLLPSTETGI